MFVGVAKKRQPSRRAVAVNIAKLPELPNRYPASPAQLPAPAGMD
jgi:hypothetical protein